MTAYEQRMVQYNRWIKVRIMHQEGMSQSEIGRQLGVTPTRIKHILKMGDAFIKRIERHEVERHLESLDQIKSLAYDM